LAQGHAQSNNSNKFILKFYLNTSQLRMA